MKNQLTILVGVACAIALAFLDAPDLGRQISATHAADLFGGQQSLESECTTHTTWCTDPNYPNGQVSCAVSVPAGKVCVNRGSITITSGNRKACHSPDPPPAHDCSTTGTYVCMVKTLCTLDENGLCVNNPNGQNITNVPSTCTNLQ